MPIPALDANGLLPAGLHDATLDEIGQRFGTFQGSDRRPHLFARLRAYADEARATHLVRWLVVDGSFVTSIPTPNDIDLVAILDASKDLRALRPFEYNVVSKRQVRRRHGFDLFAVPEGSAAVAEWLAFFAKVRDQPERQKGLLRVRL